MSSTAERSASQDDEGGAEDSRARELEQLHEQILAKSRDSASLPGLSANIDEQDSVGPARRVLEMMENVRRRNRLPPHSLRSGLPPETFAGSSIAEPDHAPDHEPAKAGAPGAARTSDGLSDISTSERMFHDCISADVISGPMPVRLPSQDSASHFDEDENRRDSRPIPRRIGRFEIRRVLGTGGCGIVFLADDPQLNRSVALKVPRPDTLATADGQERFLREAKAAAILSHPNIVTVYEAGRAGPVLYIASEFVNGPSLAQWLQQQTVGVDFKGAASLVRNLAIAVEHAHSRSVIHRDLKPGNVLIDVQGSQRTVAELTVDDLAGHVKVSDFGMARLLTEDSRSTSPGVVIGTPSYMAPEQVGTGVTMAGPAADVYGLGAVLYELLTGLPPFRASTIVETLDQVRHQEPVPPRRIRPAVPHDLETICLKCLWKEPSRRYVSAGALADDLERFLSDRPILARTTSTLERVWRWCRRHPMVSLLAVMLLIVSIGGAAGVTWKWREASLQRERAESSALRFRMERDVARQERERAEAERIRAEDNKRLAQENERRNERTHYLHRIGSAMGEWQSNRVGRTSQLLDECPEHLRDWEWSYLRSLCDYGIQTLEGHKDSIWCLAVSPDGKTIASGTGNWGQDQPGEVILWDAQTNSLIARMFGHSSGIMGMDFSPDSRSLATAGVRWESREPGGVRICSIQGDDVLTLAPPGNDAADVEYSPDGTQLVTAHMNGTLLFRDAATGRLLHTVVAHESHVFNVEFSPDGRFLVTVSRDGTVRLWDAGTREQVAMCGNYGDVREVEFSPDGNTIAFSIYGSAICLWHLDALHDNPVPNHYPISTIRSIAYGPDGRRIAIASNDGLVLLIDARTGRELKRLRVHDGVVRAICFTPDGRELLTAGTDRLVRRIRVSTDWDIETIAPGPPNSFGWIYRFAFTPDGTHLLLPGGLNRGSYGVGKKNLYLWNMAQQKIVQTFEGHTGWLNDVAVSRDGNTFATASDDQTIRLWRSDEKDSVQVLKGHKASVLSVAFHPLSDLIVSGSADGTARVQNWKSGQPLAVFSKHQGAVRGTVFLPHSSSCVSGGDDGSLRIWDFTTGEELKVLTGHTGPVTSVAVSSDGLLLASSSQDMTIRLWEVGSGRLLHTLTGHGGIVTQVAFSRNDRRVVSCSQDYTVRIWDVISGDQALTLNHSGSLLAVGFNPSGTDLLASYGSRLHRWTIHPDYETEEAEQASRTATAQWHATESLRLFSRQRFTSALFHYHRLIEFQPSIPQFRMARANAYAELGEYSSAEADYIVARGLKSDELLYAQNACYAAVAQLGGGRMNEYRQSCRQLLTEMQRLVPAESLHNLIRACILVPDAVEDFPAIVIAGRKMMESTSAEKRAMHLGTLGAALCRNSELYEARAVLLQAIDLNGKGGPIEDRLFLAIVEFRLGNRGASEEWFKQASRAIEESLNPDQDTNTPRPHWTDRFIRNLLLSEAESLLRKPDAVPAAEVR